MIEKLFMTIGIVVLIFCAGWWSAWHPSQFFAWTGRFGTFLQNKLNQTPICPKTYVCTPNIP